VLKERIRNNDFAETCIPEYCVDSLIGKDCDLMYIVISHRRGVYQSKNSVQDFWDFEKNFRHAIRIFFKGFFFINLALGATIFEQK
jgi:hypothetical protein